MTDYIREQGKIITKDNYFWGTEVHIKLFRVVSPFPGLVNGAEQIFVEINPCRFLHGWTKIVTVNEEDSFNHSFVLNSALNAYRKGNKTLPWFYRSSHFPGGYRMTGIYIISAHFDKFKSIVMNKVGVTLSETFRGRNFLTWLSDMENEKKKREREKTSLKITPKLC